MLLRNLMIKHTEKPELRALNECKAACPFFPSLLETFTFFLIFSTPFTQSTSSQILGQFSTSLWNFKKKRKTIVLTEHPEKYWQDLKIWWQDIVRPCVYQLNTISVANILFILFHLWSAFSVSLYLSFPFSSLPGSHSSFYLKYSWATWVYSDLLLQKSCHFYPQGLPS